MVCLKVVFDQQLGISCNVDRGLAYSILSMGSAIVAPCKTLRKIVTPMPLLPKRCSSVMLSSFSSVTMFALSLLHPLQVGSLKGAECNTLLLRKQQGMRIAQWLAEGKFNHNVGGSAPVY